MKSNKKLPNGWATAQLGDICEVVAGNPAPQGEIYFENGEFNFVRVQDMGRLEDAAYLSVTKDKINTHAIQKLRLFPKGSVLFTKSGASTLNNQRAILGNDGYVVSHIAAAIPSHGISSEWIYFSLVCVDFAELAHSSVMPSLPLAKIKPIQILVPPVKEQVHIVEKLEELLSGLDAGVAELKAAQKKLAQYRQSLLKAAVEGALTAEWREARRKRHSTPLSPRGRGVGGEGVQALNTSDETWFRDRARQLRQEQTPVEQLLWQQLRAKRFSGFKFRRQQKIGRYIVDFVCLAQKLIIELDGSQHADAQVEDAARDHWLRGEGFRVLRFWNNELLGQTDAVLEAIWQALQQEPPLPNPSPTRGEGLESETGVQLLQRILTERRARWEARQLAKFKEQGKTPPRDWQKKYPEPVQPDASDLPALPDGWVWATIDQIAQVGTGVTPLRSKSAYFNEGTVPWVTSGALNSETVTSAAELVTELALKECRLEIYPAGSLLVAMYGEGKTRGKCSELLIPATINQAIAAIVLEPEAQSSKAYLKAFLLDSYEKMRAQASGGVQPNLNLQIIKSIALPLPPHVEQSEITQLLDEQFDQINQQQIAVGLGLKQSTAQRQNILKAAFSGQLVPQDPSDEPASVLLERIRAERAALAASKKTRSRKTRETSS